MLRYIAVLLLHRWQTEILLILLCGFILSTTNATRYARALVCVRCSHCRARLLT